MSRFTRPRTTILGLLAAFATMAVGASTAGATGGGRHDRGTAYLSVTHTVGKTQFAAGNNNDKMLGVGAVTYRIDLPSGPNGTFKLISKRVVLYTPTGALSGTASALVIVVAAASETVINGKLALTRGTGSQKHHSLLAKFTGTADPVHNVIVFHYHGTYR